MNKNDSTQIPIIDLFAGPGGLGEGFSRFAVDKSPRFKILLSIEKDECAHRTLLLRSFFRQFDEGGAPEEYYQYLRGEIEKGELFALYPRQSDAAANEAKKLTLGEQSPSELIRERLGKQKDWVLIGGPPCQAYSLVGRSKMLGTIKREEDETVGNYKERRQAEFENDHRHQLYLEYLKVIGNHWPSIFVMENVKGILSSKLDGELIFPQILNDLKDPLRALNKRVKKGGKRYRYRIVSLTVKRAEGIADVSALTDYLIFSENYGIPQNRHRVILLGIRDDIRCDELSVLTKNPAPSVGSMINDLPKLTSGLSKGNGGLPIKALMEMASEPWWSELRGNRALSSVGEEMDRLIHRAKKHPKRGSPFAKCKVTPPGVWFVDPRLNGVCNHETRSHIKKDLWRYFFCSCFAKVYKKSPQLREFPEGLLPNHRNVMEAVNGQKFGDRFRVQVASKPATTITSHISKDGHYFIHPDPKQYRSLTVREAARIQTFPDNYFFEGPRTQQYHQVGNAVPPMLAHQIAEIVNGILNRDNFGKPADNKK